jgi:hypothetical protein
MKEFMLMSDGILSTPGGQFQLWAQSLKGGSTRGATVRERTFPKGIALSLALREDLPFANPDSLTLAARLRHLEGDAGKPLSADVGNDQYTNVTRYRLLS